MSEVKVNKISPRSGTTVTLGDSGDTFTIPSGATINNQGTATNFGATGSASWVTTVKTGDFTAVAGEGYFVNSTSGEIDVTLPAGVAGAVVAVADYANTSDTNNIILKQNGSDKIEGSTDDFVINVEGAAITLVFVDSTKGWIITDTGQSTDATRDDYIVATGGTVTTCGDCKIHKFTGPGAFCVSNAGSACGSNTVNYLVVAGGGGGGAGCAAGGGGGGGGMRFSFPNPATGGLPVSVQSYSITVGGGGTKGPGPATASSGGCGTQGASSVFASITSAGGGFGGAGAGSDKPGGAGGSGGGGGRGRPGGNGNTPSTPCTQGNNGGTGVSPSTSGGGGGGGKGAVGAGAPGSAGGNGGAGAPLLITGSAVNYAGGGGGGSYPAPTGQPTGGAGGGGKGAPTSPPLADMDGTDNTGGGGGGGSESPSYGTPTNDSPGGSGGSGIVVIRYKFQN